MKSLGDQLLPAIDERAPGQLDAGKLMSDVTGEPESARMSQLGM